MFGTVARLYWEGNTDAGVQTMCYGMHVEDRGEFGGSILAFHPLRPGLLCFCCAVSFRLAGLWAFRCFSYLYLPSHSGNAGVTNAHHPRTQVGRLSLKVLLPAELSFRSYYHLILHTIKQINSQLRKEAKCRYLYIFDILYYSPQTILLPYALPGDGLLLEFLQLLEY